MLHTPPAALPTPLPSSVADSFRAPGVAPYKEEAEVMPELSSSGRFPPIVKCGSRPEAAGQWVTTKLGAIHASQSATVQGKPSTAADQSLGSWKLAVLSIFTLDSSASSGLDSVPRDRLYRCAVDS